MSVGNIDIQFLDGTNRARGNNEQRIVDNMRKRARQHANARKIAVNYYTNGLNNRTLKNIDAVVDGLDFVGYIGDGSIEDSEMLRNHIKRTKDIVDSAPQAIAGYQNPQQLSEMLGYLLDNWDTANREKAIENMAREERRLQAEGKVNTGKDSDAHYLDEGEIFDEEIHTQLPNGMVETKPGYRGLFNRIQQASVNANVQRKDAEIANDMTFTRKGVDTLRSAVKDARKKTAKNIRKREITDGGYCHTHLIALPQETATTADTAKLLERRGSAPKKLSIELTLNGSHGINGLGYVESNDLQDLVFGVDFAYNPEEGLSGTDNVENYRAFYRRMSDAIGRNPLLYYNSNSEADAVRHFLDELIWSIGSDAAMDELVRKYSGGVAGISGAELGSLNGKLKNALKKATKAVSSAAKNVAKATVNATKQVAKTTANATKAAVKATGTAVKQVAKTTANVTKSAVQSTVNATKAAANVVKAGAQAATGNGDKAKETLKKAASQAKSAVVDPVKTAAKETVNVVKNTVVQPTKDLTKTAVQETKAVVKNAIVEPTKTIVKETIVNPIKTKLQLAKAITKSVVKVAKKVVKAILLYNPITLLIKAGLLIAFRLNMFKMSSRTWPGSLTEEDFNVWAEQNGVALTKEKNGEIVSQYELFKKCYEKALKKFKFFGGKENKLLAAMKKGASRKWRTDLGDDINVGTEYNETEMNNAAKQADNEPKFAAELEEINADTATDELELQQQGAQQSNEISPEEGFVEKGIEVEDPNQFEEKIENQKTLKEDAPIIETISDTEAKTLVSLKKGDTVLVDETQGSGDYIACSTMDEATQGFIAKSALAGWNDREGFAINMVGALVDNGDENLNGLGEVITAAAGTAAASGSIAAICSAIGGVLSGGIALVSKLVDNADKVKTVADLAKAATDSDEIQEADAGISETLYSQFEAGYVPQPGEESYSAYQQYVAQKNAVATAQTAATTTTKKSNTGLYIGIAAAALVGIGAIALAGKNNKSQDQ